MVTRANEQMHKLARCVVIAACSSVLFSLASDTIEKCNKMFLLLVILNKMNHVTYMSHSDACAKGDLSTGRDSM